MKKPSLVSNIIELTLNGLFLVFMIIHLFMNVEYTPQIGALFMVLSGAIKLINFFLNRDYSIPRLREIIDDSALIILGFVYMIVNADETTVFVTYGTIDIVDGLLGTMVVPFQERITAASTIDLFLCIGDVLFGGLLCAELLKGLRVHLIFLAITVLGYIVMKIIEIYEERKKRFIVK